MIQAETIRWRVCSLFNYKGAVGKSISIIIYSCFYVCVCFYGYYHYFHHYCRDDIVVVAIKNRIRDYLESLSSKLIILEGVRILRGPDDWNEAMDMVSFRASYLREFYR